MEIGTKDKKVKVMIVKATSRLIRGVFIFPPMERSSGELWVRNVAANARRVIPLVCVHELRAKEVLVVERTRREIRREVPGAKKYSEVGVFRGRLSYRQPVNCLLPRRIQADGLDPIPDSGSPKPRLSATAESWTPHSKNGRRVRMPWSATRTGRALASLDIPHCKGGSPRPGPGRSPPLRREPLTTRSSEQQQRI